MGPEGSAAKLARLVAWRSDWVAEAAAELAKVLRPLVEYLRSEPFGLLFWPNSAEKCTNSL